MLTELGIEGWTGAGVSTAKSGGGRGGAREGWCGSGAPGSGSPRASAAVLCDPRRRVTGPWKREERRCRGVDGEDRRRVAGGARGRAAVEVGAESSGLGEVPGVEAESREEEAAARLCDGARVEMEGGGGRPEEMSSRDLGEEEDNGFILVAKGTG